jgi:hypothetical protein
MGDLHEPYGAVLGIRGLFLVFAGNVEGAPLARRPIAGAKPSPPAPFLPMCAGVFAPPQPDPIRSRRPSDRQPRPAQKVTVPKAPNEFLSIDEPHGDKETEAPVAGTEEAEAVLPLVDDQDEKLDPAEIIEADIEKDDT